MKLREYLAENGIAITKFAKKVGTSHGTLHNIVSGVFSPKLHIAIAIVEATEGKVTYKELLSTKVLSKAHPVSSQSKSSSQKPKSDKAGKDTKKK